MALVTAADSALPMPPGVSVPLTHPGRLDGRLAAAAGRFGYRITGPSSCRPMRTAPRPGTAMPSRTAGPFVAIKLTDGEK